LYGNILLEGEFMSIIPGRACLLTLAQLNPMQMERSHIDSPLEHESLGHLLIGFLEYYAYSFPYTDKVIDCRFSSLLDKQELGWYDQTAPARLSVRCLVNEMNDIGKPTTKIDTVRQAFRDGFEILKAMQTPQNNMLGAIVGLSQKVCRNS
jgi:DNA polymerase sigma